MAKKGLDVEKALTESSTKKKRETWSQTKRTGDVTEEIRVEKLDNVGYLVIVSKSWTDSKGVWRNEELKLYSEDNPLDNNEEDNPIDKIYKYLKGGIKE